MYRRSVIPERVKLNSSTHTTQICITHTHSHFPLPAIPNTETHTHTLREPLPQPAELSSHLLAMFNWVVISDSVFSMLQKIPVDLWIKMVRQRLSKIDCVRRVSAEASKRHYPHSSADWSLQAPQESLMRCVKDVCDLKKSVPAVWKGYCRTRQGCGAV